MLDMTMSISQDQGYVDTGGINGSIAIPPPPIGKTQFFAVVPLVDVQREAGHLPGVTMTPGALSWAYSYVTRGWGFFSANARIFYGYY
ncbi:hypothetical protein POF45_00340 [Pseudomonas sp. 681]|uniref:Phage tail protein n=1 Tax=Pseudomonas fungipugnans TaxID=3024217 RepID=A0ABT6QGM2_9PSED|nr:hypothetical protein [Pseudomonas sp. 681]MDI2589881.1 hypothetical protein [Pseudomonas sp. 681]